MIRRIVLGFLAAAAIAVAAPALADPVFPAGQRIGLEPAPGLTLSARFPGFEDRDRQVLVGIVDLPGAAYDQIVRSAFAKDQQGMTGTKRESFPFASGIGVLVTGATQDKGVPVHRWFLVASSAAVAAPGIAMLIRVEVPDAARDTYTDAVIRKMLASVTYRKVPEDELLSRLPFKLTDMAGFRIAKVMPRGVIVTDGPSDDIANQPYAIVSVGRGAPERASDRGRFARNLLVSAPVSNLTMTAAEPMRIKGMPGYEIRAKAENGEGEPVKLVQWIRFGTGGFIGIVAIAGNDAWDSLFNRFRALRDGVDVR